MVTRKNLNYTARQQQAHATLLDSIVEINDTLRRDRIGVTLNERGQSLTLRYSDIDGNRKEISPKQISLTRNGVENARQCATQIWSALVGGYYDDDWLQASIYKKGKAKPKDLLWRDVIIEWGDRWLTVRAGDKNSTDRQKLVTLAGYKTQLRLIGDHSVNTIFNADFINKVLATHDEGTHNRFRCREVLSVISNLYGVSYNYKGVGRRPDPKDRIPPTDSEIIEIYNWFPNIALKPKSVKALVPHYQWYFGVLATYGLRPQELFGIDLKLSFQPQTAYWIKLDESLTDGLKTGDRWIPPMHENWVELFDLSNPKPRSFDFNDVEKKSRTIARYFDVNKIPCKPYDLRHSYGIRLRREGIPVSERAECMGHDPSTHLRQYQRHIDIHSRIESFKPSPYSK